MGTDLKLDDRRIIVCDVETTGLEPEDCVMLELGFVLCDDDGNTVSQPFDVLIHDQTPYYSTAIHEGMKHEFVGPMHEKSGLWEDLAESENCMTVRQAEDAAIEWMDANEVPHFKLPLLGSSPSGVDRPFMKYFMPTLYGMIHYRTIDTSTIKELCRRKNPVVYERLDEVAPNRELHRVIPDMEDTLAEYKFYLDNFILW